MINCDPSNINERKSNARKKNGKLKPIFIVGLLYQSSLTVSLYHTR